MKNDASYKTNGTVTLKVMCAVVFLVFTFCWLYAFQADTMAVLQHRLSEGRTTYNRTVGAVVITALLWVLQLLISMLRVHRFAFALSFLPSMLALACLSAGGLSPWLCLPVLLVWGAVYYGAHRMRAFQDKKAPTGLFSRCMWVNLLQMVLMMLGVASVSNTDAIDHFKAHAEVALLHGQTDEALRVGNRSLETDESLTMLRAFALAQRQELADRLFEYPIAGNGNDLLPDMKDSRSHLLMLSADSLWTTLGGRPATPMTTRRFLDLLAQRDTLPRRVVGDYRLCAHLVDRRLDDFARLLPIYYNKVSADSLPRYYREALFLHGQLHGAAAADSIMQQQWADYRERSAAMTSVEAYSEYGKSYWYYYDRQSR